VFVVPRNMRANHAFPIPQGVSCVACVCAFFGAIALCAWVLCSTLDSPGNLISHQGALFSSNVRVNTSATPSGNTKDAQSDDNAKQSWSCISELRCEVFCADNKTGGASDSQHEKPITNPDGKDSTNGWQGFDAIIQRNNQVLIRVAIHRTGG